LPFQLTRKLTKCANKANIAELLLAGLVAVNEKTKSLDRKIGAHVDMDFSNQSSVRKTRIAIPFCHNDVVMKGYAEDLSGFHKLFRDGDVLAG
jgi:hypothetical protein